MNYVYILKCADDTLYCGWTTDPDARLRAHNSGRGAKYTRSRLPVEMVYLEEFEDKCTENLLGPSWHQHVADGYLDFCERYENRNKGEKALKAEFKKQALRAFYDAMGYIFRDGFGTDSQTARNVLSGITDLFLGKDQ